MQSDQNDQNLRMRHRLSMVELQNLSNTQLPSTQQIGKRKRNSSIEANNKIPNTKQFQSTKSIGLTFTKHKSRRSMNLGDTKENKQTSNILDEGAIKFSQYGPPPKKRNLKSKFSMSQHSSKQFDCSQMTLAALEKQLTSIMEQSVKQQKRGISVQHFKFIQKLGDGSYSQVFLVIQKHTNTLYAIKTLKKDMLKQPGALQRLLSQLKIQLYCNHPNIVKLYAIFEDNTNIYLLQQYAGKDTLYSIMSKQTNQHHKMPVQIISNCIAQLCSALAYLHTHCIIHRDIKPQNVLIAPGGMVKLTDFGWSIHNPDNSLRKTFCGTPIYFSPELLSAQSYDQTVDIWAIGVLTYQLLTGSNPFNIKCFQQLGKIVSEQVNLSKIQNHKARDFISQLLIKERVLRRQMRDLIDHPFLALCTSAYRK